MSDNPVIKVTAEGIESKEHLKSQRRTKAIGSSVTSLAGH